MNFKQWLLEGEYGSSAYGPIDATLQGSSNFQGANTDEFTRKGIGSKYQQVDKPKRKSNVGSKNVESQPVGVSGYGDDLPPRRVAAAFV